jgi:hypothetical protein
LKKMKKQKNEKIKIKNPPSFGLRTPFEIRYFFHQIKSRLCSLWGFDTSLSSLLSQLCAV